MNQDLLHQKADVFVGHEDNYSSLKHEFSRIFHENNLHSFTNASDIGFLDLGKSNSQKFTSDYDDIPAFSEMGNMIGRSYQREDISPSNYMNLAFRSSQSPMTFLQTSLTSNPSYNMGYQDVGNITPNASYAKEPTNYLSYQPYQYGDYAYSDYSTQPNSAYPQNQYESYDHSDILDTHPNNPLSLMWSNETGNDLKTKEQINGEPKITPQENSQQKVGLVSVGQSISKKEAPLKLEQDFEKVSNRVLNQQLELASKPIPENNTSMSLRRTSRNIKPLNKDSFVNNEDSESEDEKDENTKNKGSKGLRTLSIKVHGIVSKRKKTSYKDVSDALLEDLNQKLKGKTKSEITKEEQNIKRRIYDALNVLIAAGALKKEGKFVCSDSSDARFGSGQKGSQDKETLLKQIQEINKRKAEKMEALQDLIFKSLAIRNLIRKNKEKAEKEYSIGKFNRMQEFNKINSNMLSAGSQNVNATRIDVVQENATLNQKNQDVIRFPFIVIKSSSSSNAMNVNMESNQRQLNIESKMPFQIFGDIDVLLKMRLHYVSRDIFEKDIPKGLWKFISDVFINSLQ